MAAPDRMGSAVSTSPRTKGRDRERSVRPPRAEQAAHSSLSRSWRPDVSQGAQRIVGTYVYCVGSAELFGPGRPSLKGQAVGGPDVEVRTVEYGDLAAVVSDAPVMNYDITRDNLLAHQRVVEES